MKNSSEAGRAQKGVMFSERSVESVPIRMLATQLGASIPTHGYLPRSTVSCSSIESETHDAVLQAIVHVRSVSQVPGSRLPIVLMPDSFHPILYLRLPVVPIEQRVGSPPAPLRLWSASVSHASSRTTRGCQFRARSTLTTTWC